MTVAALNELRAGGPRAKALKLNGVEPSPASLADGTCPLFSSFSLITDETPSPLAARFIDFVQSEPGRKILAETGHWIPSPSPARQP